MDLLRLSGSWPQGVVLQISWWVLVAAVLAALLTPRMLRRWWPPLTKYDVVDIDVALGNVGHVRFRPNTKDAQIAHQIWTELITRKAAIPIDPDRDVLAEVYDSWYELFGRVRSLIAEIPADLLRRDESTRQLVRIATQTLNEGLRPHLTRWQAEFRNWMQQHEEELKDKSPQELQKGFPQCRELIADLRAVNQGLIQYAAALEKIAKGQRRETSRWKRDFRSSWNRRPVSADCITKGSGDVYVYRERINVRRPGGVVEHAEGLGEISGQLGEADDPIDFWELAGETVTVGLEDGRLWDCALQVDGRATNAGKGLRARQQ